MDKIKCITSKTGYIIPIHNISLISGTKASHFVWTNVDSDGIGREISDRSYNILLENLDIIDRRGFKD